MIELIAVLSFFLHKHADVWVALSLLVCQRRPGLLPGAARIDGGEGAAQQAPGDGASPAGKELADRGRA